MALQSLRRCQCTCRAAQSCRSISYRTLPTSLAEFQPLLDVHPRLQPPDSPVQVFNDPPVFSAYAEPEEFDLQEASSLESPLRALAKSTSLTDTQIKDLHRYALDLHRVSNMTTRGRIATMYALVVVGNGNGLVGLGEGKHAAAGRAIDKAFNGAVRNLAPVQRFEGRTVWGERNGKFGAVRIQMFPRPPGLAVQWPSTGPGLTSSTFNSGFGLTATSPLIHQIAKAAGVSDLTAKIRGSGNKMNTCKLAVRMLQSRSNPLGESRIKPSFLATSLTPRPRSWQWFWQGG